MKNFTIDDIRSWKPCYDPSRHLSKDWVGTCLDIVMTDEIPWEDRLWVVMRNNLVSDKLMRLFAVWCARQVLHLTTDRRSVGALHAAERFAKGNATTEEMYAARAAAWDAAQDAAWDTVLHAARAAAQDAARAAARAAAQAAAQDAARAAAWDAAQDAAQDAAWDAAWDAARAAARAAAQAAQKDQLVIMLLEGEDAGDVK